jgi:hypothetical protein
MRVSGDSGLRAIVSVAFCVALGGCATGFNRGEMDAALQSAKPSYVSSELSVEEIDALRPQVNLPARIAIAPPIQTYQRWWGQRSLDTWSPDEIAILESWQEPLRSAGVASEILILPSSLVKDCEVRDSLCRLKSQRAAAARVHADALLVINLATATDEYVNPASALYLTIIGMWLVPASHRDALTVAEGVLLDTRNEYLYAFARGEGESQSVRPAMYADTVAVVGMSRVEALRDFGGSFLEQARHLRVK